LLLATVAAAPCRDLTPSDPAWQAVNAQYGRIAEAQRTKNIDELAALYASDMTVIGLKGEQTNREQSLNYSRAAFSAVVREIHTTNVILSLRLCGDRATARVLQQWSRIQKIDDLTRRRCRTKRGSRRRTAGSDGESKRFAPVRGSSTTNASSRENRTI